jgi:DNA-directed RNA polymerase specialized sigma subunit
MTVKELQKILLYHNKGGFVGDLKDIQEKIIDLRGSNSEMSSFTFKLAIPQNRNNTSTVEICVMNNVTLLDLEVQAKEMERFIQRLDFAIETLPDNERHVIRARYFNKQHMAMDFINVAADTNYSVDWCEKLNKRALKSICRELSGVQVTWSDGD